MKRKRSPALRSRGFRVRWYKDKWNEADRRGFRGRGYAPATVQRMVYASLKRAGYVQTENAPGAEGETWIPGSRARTVRMPRASVPRSIWPRTKPLTCNWVYHRQRRPGDWGWYHGVRCPLLATTFLGPENHEAYCDLHGDKAIRRDAYFERQNRKDDESTA